MLIRHGWVSNSSSCMFLIKIFPDSFEGLEMCKEKLREVIKFAHEFRVKELNKTLKLKKQKNVIPIKPEDYTDEYYDATTHKYADLDKFFWIGSRHSKGEELEKYNTMFDYMKDLSADYRHVSYKKLSKKGIIIETKFEDGDNYNLMSFIEKKFNVTRRRAS